MHTTQTAAAGRPVAGRRRKSPPPAGVEKVSSEDSIAASSLVRWSGPAALLGGLSTVFVDEVILFHQSQSKGE